LATLRELGFLMLDQTAIASSGVTGLGDLILCPMPAQNAFEDLPWAERAKTSHDIAGAPEEIRTPDPQIRSLDDLPRNNVAVA
jgi:hypothetical protein